MRFGEIDSFVWFGSGRLLHDSAVSLQREGFRNAVFSGRRHLDEAVDEDGTTLAAALGAAGIPVFESPDINADARLAEHVTDTTLGLALGPAWIFRTPVLERFGDRFVNFMGIDLPRYRGGAHYTWQILQGNRRGSVNLQLINEVVDSGAIVKHREYLFPAEARIPRDYFDAAGEQERSFFAEFLDEVKAGADFPLQGVQEKFAQHFPYLHTDTQGWVDWRWDVGEIERFVCAFDEPYPGASTLLDGRRVRLRDVRAERADGPFHPFMAGMVYASGELGTQIACAGGTLVAGRVVGEDGEELGPVTPGRRLFTPQDRLDEAMAFRAVYTADGIRAADPGLRVMAIPRLEGEAIYLRELTTADVGEDYERWMNDPEVTRYLESRFAPQSRADIAAFVTAMAASTDDHMLAIVLREGDRHIGNIKLGPVNAAHRFADVGILIGDREQWGRGRASAAIALLTDHAFAALGLHKLNAGCYAANAGSARAFERAGYEREGLRRRQYDSDGTWMDEILLGRVAPGG